MRLHPDTLKRSTSALATTARAQSDELTRRPVRAAASSNAKIPDLVARRYSIRCDFF
jgi:hypothetical protein